MTRENARKLFFVAIPVGLLSLYALARWTGAFAVYRVPTANMAPNYPANSFACASNWVKPGRNDVVVYRDSSVAIPNYRTAKGEIFIGRLVALAGDVLEIRAGQVYIDGQRPGGGLRLLFGWSLSPEDYRRNQAFFKAMPPENLRLQGSPVVVYLEVGQAEELRASIPALQRHDQLVNESGFYENWGAGSAGWTLDHFGPVTVPPGQVFILGDNRHNAEDSRYRGCVPADQIMGKLLL